VEPGRVAEAFRNAEVFKWPWAVHRAEFLVALAQTLNSRGNAPEATLALRAAEEAASRLGDDYSSQERILYLIAGVYAEMARAEGVHRALRAADDLLSREAKREGVKRILPGGVGEPIRDPAGPGGCARAVWSRRGGGADSFRGQGDQGRFLLSIGSP